MGGGDKGLLELGGKSVLARITATLRRQASATVLNANGDPARFAALGLEVVADSVPGLPGPLAGVLAGLERGADLGLPWVVSAPGDAPFLPDDLVARLHARREAAGADLAVAASGGREHPVVALWPTALRDALRRALESDVRRVRAFQSRFQVAAAQWPAEPLDPFLNLNTPEDVLSARERL